MFDIFANFIVYDLLGLNPAPHTGSALQFKEHTLNELPKRLNEIDKNNFIPQINANTRK